MLLDLDRIQPTKRAFVQRQRAVLLVGMFSAGSIDAGIPRAQEAEDEKEKAGDDERVDDGGVDGVLLDLASEY
jgi:hypothetical protein